MKARKEQRHKVSKADECIKHEDTRGRNLALSPFSRFLLIFLKTRYKRGSNYVTATFLSDFMDGTFEFYR